MGNKSSHKHAVEKAISKPSIDCDGAFRIVFDHVYDKKFKVEDKNYATQLQLIQDMFPQIEEVVLPLFAYLSQCTTHSLQYMTYDNFMTNVLRFATAPDADKPVMLEYYFDIFSQRQQSLNRDPALWISCYKASLMTAGLSDELPLASEESIFPSLLKSLFKDNQQVSRMDLVPWCAGNCRTLLMETDLQNYITQEMSDGRIKCSTKHPDFQVEVSERSNRDALAAKDYVLTPALLWATVMCVGTHDVFYPDHSSVSSTFRAIVHGGWVPLYSSKQHGLSVSRFKHYVFDYDGPTILVLSFNEKIFCLASNIAWNETSTQWRGKECVVFMLLDEWKVVSRDPNSVYFNLTERSAPRGIHVGKYGRGPLIAINEDFSTVKYWEIEYKLDDMEVWGCGGQKILDAQQKQQRWEKEQAERQKDRKLKLEDWKDNPDRQLLQLGGVTTEHAQR